MKNAFVTFLAALALLLAIGGTAWAEKPKGDKNNGDHGDKAAQQAAPPAEDHGAAPAPAPAGEPAAAADPDEEPPQPAHHEPVNMKIGVDLESINKFDLASGSFQAEFIASVTCDREPCKPRLDIKNGKLQGKIETLADEKLHKKYKMKAEIDGWIDLSEFPFDKHVLAIQLENKADLEGSTLLIDEQHVKLGERVKLAGWDINPAPEAVILQEDLEDGEKSTYMLYGAEIIRPRTPAFVKSLVPVIIMLFSAAFQLLLKPKGAAGRLSASVGSLSALVMFHVSQVNSLPAVSYLTRFDKFMIATYLVVLVHIMLNIMMVRAEEAKNENRSMIAYLVSAGLIPGLALIGWVSVFVQAV